jgi:hypothetical protein
MSGRLKNQPGRPAPGKDLLILEEAQKRMDQVRPLYENTAEREQLVQTLARELEEDPAFARYFMEKSGNIAESWNVSLLTQLSERVPSKPLRRKIKGAIYQLRQRGIDVVEKDPEASRGILKQAETQAAEGYLSDFDDLGNRMVALVLPRLPQGRILVFGLTHWDRGLGDLSALEVSKKQVRTLLEETEQHAGQPFHPAPAGHGVFLLREAHEHGGRLQPEDEKVYTVLNNYLESLGPFPAEPIIYSLGEEEGGTDGAVEWETLKEIPELVRFHLPPEEMEAYARPLLEIKESPLVLSPTQQEERIQEVLSGAVEAVFGGGRTRRLQRFVEEIATAYWLKGLKDQARRIMAALKSFQPEVEGRTAPGHPLLSWLVEKEFRLSREMVPEQEPPQEERTEGGVILPAWVKK